MLFNFVSMWFKSVLGHYFHLRTACQNKKCPFKVVPPSSHHSSMVSVSQFLVHCCLRLCYDQGFMVSVHPAPEGCCFCKSVSLITQHRNATLSMAKVNLLYSVNIFRCLSKSKSMVGSQLEHQIKTCHSGSLPPQCFVDDVVFPERCGHTLAVRVKTPAIFSRRYC